MTERPNILLDTCALLFVANDTKISDLADEEISEAAHDGRLYISPISAWEMGVGVAKGRLKLPLEPLDFFRRFMSLMKAQLTDLSPAILIGSSHLPGRVHGDPADRILIASARQLDMVLVTRDEPMLDYGADGNIRALAC